MLENKKDKIYRILREEKNWEFDFISTLEEIQSALYQYFGILMLVDFEYECDDTPFFYKIYKFKNIETREPERVPIIGVSYDENNTPTEHIVGYRQWKKSNKDYSNYKDAFEEGLLEAVKMIEK